MTFRVLFRRIGVRPRGWRLVSPHFPAVAQTTRSSVMLYPSLSAEHWFCAVWSETLCKLRNAIHSLKTVRILLRTHFRVIRAYWDYFISLLLCIS